jgi:hypothetical protein
MPDLIDEDQTNAPANEQLPCFRGCPACLITNLRAAMFPWLTNIALPATTPLNPQLYYRL